jgi:hypothetical protein
MEMPELKLLPEVGIYSNSAGTDFACWNKRSGKFLSESMGMAYDLPITHWANLPDGPNT